MNTKLMDTASGKIPADLVVKNGKIVNVYTREIYDGGVAVSGDQIAAVGNVDYTVGPNTQIIDAKGKFLTPGFIEGHIHPESSSLSIRSFAEIILKHGTTVIMTDFHEIGVVGGLEAIEAELKENEITDLKIYFIVPSHIPFAPSLETSGGKLDSKIVQQALKRKDAVGLSECVGAYIINQYPDLLQSMDLTLSAGKSLQGHLPDMLGAELNVCLAAGITTDHESLGKEDALAKLRGGCHLMMREGSSAGNMADCLRPILEQGLDTSRVSIITDDLHTIDAVERGHLDESVRKALSNGADFITAIQMVTLNAARAFQLDHEIGGLAPGKRADINITDGPECFKVLGVISGGKQVVADETLLVKYEKAMHDPCLLNTMKLQKSITGSDLFITAPASAKKVRVKVMDTLPFIPITTGREVTLKVENGIVSSDKEQDVLYIAQVERYGINGNIGKAFMGGFHMKSGAIASSVGHDNHNIIVLGENVNDMAKAVNRVAELDGGQVVVQDGKIIAELAYPVCGLLSDLSAEELADEKRKLNDAARLLGCSITYPFMFLSFICLAALPEYAITDHGFIDVLNQKVIDPILEIIE